MNRKEMETVLASVMELMRLLLPYVNPPDQEEWAGLIGIVETVVFATDEEA